MAAVFGLLASALLLSSSVTKTLCLSDYEELRHKYDQVVHDMADLKYVVVGLKEDVKQMTKVTTALNNLCAELRIVGAADGLSDDSTEETEEPEASENSQERGDEEPGTNIPVQMTSFDMDNETFRVEYTSSEEADVFINDPQNLFFEALSSFSDGQGVITGPKLSDDTYVSISTDHYGAAFAIGPDENNTSASRKVNIEPLLLKSNISGELIFDEGESKEVKITFGKSKSKKYDFSYAMYTPSKNETGRNATVINTETRYPGIVNETKREDHPDKGEVTLTINSNRSDYEGLLFFSLSEYTYDHLYFYSVNQLSVVKRSGHSEPFEPGYIGFVRSVVTDFEQQCVTGERCELHAMIIGNTPEDVTLWKINEGKKSEIQVPTRRKRFHKYVFNAIFYLGDVSQEDQGRYVYHGTSSTIHFD